MNTLKKRFFPFALTSKSPANLSNYFAPPALRLVTTDTDGPVPIDQQLADSFNANNAVLAYVMGISRTILAPFPTPPAAPSWYSDFEKAFSEAQGHANTWYPISTALVSVPQDIVLYGITFDADMNEINALIAQLQQNPNNTEALNSLKNLLASLLSNIQFYSRTATATQTQVDTFATNLTSDAAMMAQAVADANSSIGADNTQIAQLQSDINALQQQIQTWQTVATVSESATTFGFTACVVISLFTFGMAFGVGVIGTTAGLATAIAANIEVMELKAQVDNDTVEIDELNQQIAALTVMNSQLATLISLSNTSNAQIDLILQAWTQLEVEINQVISDLEKSEGDTDPLYLTQLQIDLNTANQDWQTLVAYCNVMASVQYTAGTPPTANVQ